MYKHLIEKYQQLIYIYIVNTRFKNQIGLLIHIDLRLIYQWEW